MTPGSKGEGPPVTAPGTRWGGARRIAAALLAATATALAGAPCARAHQVGLSFGQYAARGDAVEVRLELSPDEVVKVAPGVDADGDGRLQPADMPRAGAELHAATLGTLAVDAGGRPCALAPGDVSFDDVDGVVLRGTFTCAERSGPLGFHVGYLAAFPPGHRHLAKVEGAGEVREFLAYAAAPRFTAEVGRTSSLETAGRFFTLGIEHIFTGIDHLLFLLGLLLLGGTLGHLLGIVTSFTVAHSITLALATLGVVAPSPSWVEPAIALSIVYVAVENLWRQSAPGRWRLTFAFGLIHGFGFAGVLRELELPRADLAASLVSFNLGVEAGQLVVVAAALPALLALRRRDWFAGPGVRALSAGLAGVGAVWFVDRVWG